MRAKMKDDVKDIFSNVNEWLKFAEAKNAALIAFHLGSIFGAATIITQTECGTIPQPILYYLYSFIILSALGLFFAMFSFWPQTKIEAALSKKIEDFFHSRTPTTDGNLLFYGYIDECGKNRYLKELCGCYNRQQGSCTKLELDYVEQIFVNSRITVRKYFYFKIALLVTIVAVLSPISIPLIFLYNIVNCLLMKQYKRFLIHITFLIISSVIVWKLIWKYVIV